jgi:hypothetical protein
MTKARWCLCALKRTPGYEGHRLLWRSFAIGLLAIGRRNSIDKAARADRQPDMRERNGWDS